MEVREIFNVTDANNDFPGKEEARRLLGAREGVGEAAKEIFGKAMDRCSTDPVIRSARQAKFEAAEARGERGLLVQLPEPFGVVSLEDSFQRLEEFMPEAVKPSSWPGETPTPSRRIRGFSSGTGRQEGLSCRSPFSDRKTQQQDKLETRMIPNMTDEVAPSSAD
ncbi:hypothetical protein PG997_010322 [Apiospora hydei]|uniref:Uncharacterized protein n=1 Tax=Apiospora hydei TaxID=1337664 RepID=A0ABR1VWQ2_9PEZI